MRIPTAAWLYYGQKQTQKGKRANRVEGSHRGVCLQIAKGAGRQGGQVLWDDGAKAATATFLQQLPDNCGACLGATVEGQGARTVLKSVLGCEKHGAASGKILSIE